MLPPGVVPGMFFQKPLKSGCPSVVRGAGFDLPVEAVFVAAGAWAQMGLVINNKAAKMEPPTLR